MKFTSEGGRIEVQTDMEATKDAIVVSVSDTGKGIAPEVFPRLFTAFEQGSADVTRSFGGLGLGLSIAKALVEMHNGTLIAASEGEGKGAQFVVTLPLSALICTPEYDSANVATAAAAEGATLLTDARILLVEDNAATAAILQRLMTKLRYRWSAASSVTEALMLARSAEFDVLICDIGLPDGSGLEVVGKMRALQPACKSIALSGYGTAEDVQRSLDAGSVTHLTQPVRCAELTSAIELLLQPKSFSL